MAGKASSLTAPPFDPGAFAAWAGGTWQGGMPSSIRGVSNDTRTLAPGNLYLALRGEKFDGHSFVPDAFAKGAAGAMVSSGWRAPGCPNGPLLRVPDTAKALRAAASAYRRALDPEVIAVTGSVGKTTVKEMAAAVLSARCVTARTRGNWNNDVGLPLSLLDMDPRARVGVFELGVNHPGEMAPLCELLAPDWGIVTAIAPVHLEFFSSVEAIAREKAAVFRSLPGDGVGIYCADDAHAGVLASALKCRRLTVALDSGADYTAAFECGESGPAVVRERDTGSTCRLLMPLPGLHHLVNALFAVAAGRAHGIGWDEIRTALEAYRTQPMRWERSLLSGALVVNDAYNANPTSMRAALRAFAQMEVSGRKWVVLGGMRELGRLEEEEHEAIGREAAAAAPWAGLVTVGSLGALIARAAAGLGPGRLAPCADHAEAAAFLARSVRPGDAVLLKASRSERLEDVLNLWARAAGAAPEPIRE